jgi:hypothetical protein
MNNTPSQDIYPRQLLAQKLNNRAAHCIEIGQYQQATSNLVKALKLCEESSRQFEEEDDDTSSMDVDHSPCPCRLCSLDHCMTYSQRVSQQAESSMSDSDGINKKIDNNSTGGGYVYQQPIRVSPQTMEEGHSMGNVLSLMLTFNLALTHHLEALASTQAMSRSKLQRVLRLYELAYRWQIEEESIQAESLRFTMVIANNLGEIHRAVSNRDKHQKCLEHLLSTVMFMVDCRETENTMDMDGFLRNTSELILHSHCAGAA